MENPERKLETPITNSFIDSAKLKGQQGDHNELDKTIAEANIGLSKAKSSGRVRRSERLLRKQAYVRRAEKLSTVGDNSDANLCPRVPSDHVRKSKHQRQLQSHKTTGKKKDHIGKSIHAASAKTSSKRPRRKPTNTPEITMGESKVNAVAAITKPFIQKRIKRNKTSNTDGGNKQKPNAMVKRLKSSKNVGDSGAISKSNPKSKSKPLQKRVHDSNTQRKKSGSRSNKADPKFKHKLSKSKHTPATNAGKISLTAESISEGHKPKRGRRKRIQFSMKDVLSSAHSSLLDIDLGDVLNMESFMKYMDPADRAWLYSLLPEIDQTAEGVRKLFTCNMQFMSSLTLYQNFLRAGHYDPQYIGLHRNKRRRESQRLGKDHKVDDFEQVWGIRIEPKPVTEPKELDKWHSLERDLIKAYSAIAK